MGLPRLVGRIGVVASLALSMGLATAPSGNGVVAVGAGTHDQRGGGATKDGRIVFDDFGTGQLYTVNPNGNALIQVTHLHAGQVAERPEWSPRSKRIIFDSNKSGQFRIYLMRPDGSHLHRLAPDRPGYADFEPTFTPDGRRVIYSRCRPDPPGGCAIYSIRRDGTGRHALTQFRHGARQGVDFSPEVSPNGKQIAFARFESGGIGAQVWVMRSDGTHAHPITAARLEGASPTWTPDGKHLLFFSNSRHLGLSVYSVRTDGTQLRRLTTPRWPNNDLFPSAAPGGNRIAFVSDRTHPDLCCQDLYVMRSDTSGQHIINTGLQLVGDPDWGSAPLLHESPKTLRPAAIKPLSAAQLRAAKAAELSADPWLRGLAGSRSRFPLNGG